MGTKVEKSKNSVNVATLKAKLSEYLGLAKGGMEVIVTDHKLPVARLVPFLIDAKEGLVAREASLPLSSLIKISETVGKRTNGFDSFEALMEDRKKR